MFANVSDRRICLFSENLVTVSPKCDSEPAGISLECQFLEQASGPAEVQNIRQEGGAAWGLGLGETVRDSFPQ